jgi:hypothetical protein
MMTLSRTVTWFVSSCWWCSVNIHSESEMQMLPHVPVHKPHKQKSLYKEIRRTRPAWQAEWRNDRWPMAHACAPEVRGPLLLRRPRKVTANPRRRHQLGESNPRLVVDGKLRLGKYGSEPCALARGQVTAAKWRPECGDSSLA